MAANRRAAFRRLPWPAVALVGALAGPVPAGEPELAACLDCHGSDGVSPDPSVPSLGGQPQLFLLYQLVYFRERQRKAEPMTVLMADASDVALQSLATEIAGQPPPPSADGADLPLYSQGKEIAARRRCGSCHRPDFSGAQHVPRLAGQQEAYLRKALDDYITGARIGTQAAMAEVLSGLDGEELAALAYFFRHFDG